MISRCGTRFPCTAPAHQLPRTSPPLRVTPLRSFSPRAAPPALCPPRLLLPPRPASSLPAAPPPPPSPATSSRPSLITNKRIACATHRPHRLHRPHRHASPRRLCSLLASPYLPHLLLPPLAHPPSSPRAARDRDHAKHKAPERHHPLRDLRRAEAHVRPPCAPPTSPAARASVPLPPTASPLLPSLYSLSLPSLSYAYQVPRHGARHGRRALRPDRR